MTTRGQFLRSTVPGNVPAAGTRQPGELWINFPDLQLGAIDTSRNAQKLIAVRFFSAAANYVAGDFVIQAGALYAAKGAVPAGAFNPAQWTKVAAATDAGGPYLPITGGTLTGALTLNADPGAALGAATKQYVDGKVSAAPFLPIAGGTLTGLVTLSGPPVIPLHAATKAYVDSGAFVPIGGGTMTGDLILNRDAVAPLQAATFEQVNARGAGDNRIINGDMRIDQRNNGASGTSSPYTIDCWQFNATQASKFTWGRNLNAITGPVGFPYYLGCQSSSSYVLLSSDQFWFQQPIEADLVSDFAWGTINAQPVTLSFWARSSLTGTFSGAIFNYAANRSYPFTFSLPTANTWTKVALTIPGDTGGTWVMYGNGGALEVCFDLGSGATYRGPANVWASANYRGATGAVSVVGTNGATFYLTGVKLETGSVATPYPRQSLAKSMADCQRYYQYQPYLLYTAYSSAASTWYTTVPLQVLMRAAPTVVYSNQVYTNASALVTNNVTNTALAFNFSLNAAGIGNVTFSASFSAEL